MLQVRQSQAAGAPPPAVDAQSPSSAAPHSVYAPSSATRLGGAIGTAAIFGVAVGVAMLATLHHVVQTKSAEHLAVFDVSTPPAPTEELPPKDVPELKDRAEPKVAMAQATPQMPTITIPVALSTPTALQPSQAPAEPAMESKEASAPPPPPPRQAGRKAATWEEQVLSALNAVRRYPRLAVSRRQQGVPYIRFLMDRDGVVKSAKLERSSGFPELDREATALPKRASPLPPPDDAHSGSIIELVVPVEFFIN